MAVWKSHRRCRKRGKGALAGPGLARGWPAGASGFGAGAAARALSEQPVGSPPAGRHPEQVLHLARVRRRPLQAARDGQVGAVRVVAHEAPQREAGVLAPHAIHDAAKHELPAGVPVHHRQRARENVEGNAAGPHALVRPAVQPVPHRGEQLRLAL